MDHEPVLLTEVLAGLTPQVGETVLDATVNRGGHAKALGEKLGVSGHLIGLDADPEALAVARVNLSALPCRLTLLSGNFRQVGDILTRAGVETIDKALFDVGLSSQQLADPQRGFSFQSEGPLLMTFSGVSDAPFTAHDIVNDWAEDNLVTILRHYGEEHYATRITRAIVAARRVSEIRSTSQLVAIIEGAVPTAYRRRRLHPATKTFQALRIAVNDELRALAEGLSQAWTKLRLGGRLAVITFQAGEVRVVKSFYQQEKLRGCIQKLSAHAVKPRRTEVLSNPRARSATLRLFEKLL